MGEDGNGHGKTVGVCPGEQQKALGWQQGIGALTCLRGTTPTRGWGVDWRKQA